MHHTRTMAGVVIPKAEVALEVSLSPYKETTDLKNDCVKYRLYTTGCEEHIYSPFHYNTESQNNQNKFNLTIWIIKLEIKACCRKL